MPWCSKRKASHVSCRCTSSFGQPPLKHICSTRHHTLLETNTTGSGTYIHPVMWSCESSACVEHAQKTSCYFKMPFLLYNPVPSPSHSCIAISDYETGSSADLDFSRHHTRGKAMPFRLGLSFTSWRCRRLVHQVGEWEKKQSCKYLSTPCDTIMLSSSHAQGQAHILWDT